MRRRLPGAHAAALFLLASGLLGPVCPARGSEAGDAALWRLWHMHEAQPADHQAVLQSCKAFERRHPDDPLVGLTRTLAAWHLLQLGQSAQAEALLLRCLKDGGGGPLERGASTIASSWMTRIDREVIKEALQFFYKKNVRYPRALAELKDFAPLPDDLNPRYEDRFGMAWRYTLVGFKTIPGLADQKYDLQSVKLGETSDLFKALKEPYGERIRLKPVGVRSPDAVEFTRSGAAEATTLVTVGLKVDDILVAYVGRRMVILCDHDYWKVLAVAAER